MRRHYLPELDLLRCFAFFMVFLSHVVPGDEAFFAQVYLPAPVARAFIAMAAGGAFGVDLFFVLSSFLITSLLLREHAESGTISVAPFYLRRILRIWPLYFTFLLVIAPLLKHVLPLDDMPGKYTLAYSFLAGNWACAWWGYPHSVAGPLWSVSIEEQFYLSWPLVLRRWPNHVVAAALTMLVIACFSRLWLVDHGAVHPQVWCNTLCRLDPIASGALVAVWARRKTVDLSTPTRLTLVLIGGSMITAAAAFGDYVGTRALITFPASAVACTLLLIAALDFRLPTERRWIIRAVLYLGRISYGLYVFHLTFVSLFDVASAHTPLDRTTRTAAALVTTIGAAALSYHCFERYFLRLKGRFAHVRPVG